MCLKAKPALGQPVGTRATAISLGNVVSVGWNDARLRVFSWSCLSWQVFCEYVKQRINWKSRESINTCREYKEQGN